MHLAAIGDIHGNLSALQAVLSEIDESGIETLLHTGDAVVGYPWPNEVIDVLRERGAACVQGEADRLAVRFLKKQQTLGRKWPAAAFESLRWTYEMLRSENLEFLRGLPKTLRLRLEGIDIALFHGVLGSQTEELRPHDAIERFQRQREQARSPLVVCGRSHEAFSRWVEDTLFVNPGSVGVPSDHQPLARYVVIDTESEPWEAHFREVPYDMGAVEARLVELGLDGP